MRTLRGSKIPWVLLIGTLLIEGGLFLYSPHYFDAVSRAVAIIIGSAIIILLYLTNPQRGGVSFKENPLVAFLSLVMKIITKHWIISGAIAIYITVVKLGLS